MSRAAHFDHDVIDPASAWLPPMAFDDEEEGEDEGEGESLSASANYGSLLGLAVVKREKKPVLVLDPEEAESAADQFQLVAAQGLAEAGRSDRVCSLAPLAGMDEAEDEPEPEEEWDEWGDSAEASVEEWAGNESAASELWTDEAMPAPGDPTEAGAPEVSAYLTGAEEWQAPIAEAEPGWPSLEFADEPAEPAPEPVQLSELAAGLQHDEVLEPDWAGVEEEDETPTLDEDRYEFQVQDEDEVDAWFDELASADVESAPAPEPEVVSGHSLRAALIRVPAVETPIADEIRALLRRVRDWLAWLWN